jgi:hypothetical protein
MQSLHESSFFLTRIAGEEYGDVLGLMMDSYNIVLMSFSTSSFCLWGILYGLIFGGVLFSCSGML